jgi:amino acid adenylation domain-containing protein
MSHEQKQDNNCNNVPLNDAQRSIWLHTLSLRRQYKDEGAMYNIGCKFVVHSNNSDHDAQEALRRCCSTRPELLTTFNEQTEMLEVGALAPEQLLYADVRLMSEQEQSIVIERACTEAFSLRHGDPLVRVVVTRSKLVMILHHLLTDGFGLHSYIAPTLTAALDGKAAVPGAVISLRSNEKPESAADHRAFWLQHIPPPGDLIPLDMPQPDHPPFAPVQALKRPTFATHQFELPAQLQQWLVLPGGKVSASSDKSVSFFSWMLSSLWALWAQYATRFDFGVGVAFANRPASPSVWNYAKVLPVYPHLFARSSSSSENVGALDTLSWLALVEHIQQAVRAAKAHEAVQMIDLAEDRSVATQVNLVITESQFDIFSCGSPSELTIYMRMPPRDMRTTSTADQRPVVLEYIRRSDGQLSELAVRQLHDNWMTLLEQTREKMHALESWRTSLAWVAPYQSLAVMWPNFACDYHVPRQLESVSHYTLHGMFAESARLWPCRIAVHESASRQMCYAELDSTSTRLAHDLRLSGVRPGHRVVLLMSRSLKAMQCILAILKTGAMYVPVDAALPQARILYIVQQAEASLVICTAQHSVELSKHAPAGTCFFQVDEAPYGVEAGAAADPQALPRPDPLASAYIIFTSGSTGQPKGVEIVHRNVCNSIHALDTVVAPTENDAILQSASLSFDMSVGQIFNAWRTGAALVLLMDATDWEGTINRQKVSILQIPASVLASAFDIAALPKSLRAVQIGGEPLPQALSQKLMHSNPLVQFSNMYGPTEGSIYSNMTILDPSWNYTPIGPPLRNQREYILNDLLQVVPPGVPGRLFMGGMAPARGYYGRPELTQERFVHDPFAEKYPSIPGVDRATMYDSGDIVRWRQANMVECIGRSDQQVKWHGLRIELGEIESCLLSCPSVAIKASAARLCPLASGQEDTQVLVGYVVLLPSTTSASSSSSHTTESLLRAHLDQHLPKYMVPSHILTIEALPVSSSGKLDRNRLPIPPPAVQLPASSGERLLSPSTRQPQGDVHRSPALVPASSAPSNPEQLLRGAWLETLPQLGTRPESDWSEMHFFDNGGTSLSLVKLLRLVHVRFPNATFTAADLFARPTFAEMLRLLASRHGRKLSKLPQIQEQSLVRLSSSDPLREPIHIIGMAGTFPGALSVGEFWKLLCTQTVVTKETATATESSSSNNNNNVRTAAGRLLQDPFEFDAEAFGIRTEEAMLMDPQHRIALQQTLYALDDAGIVPRALAVRDFSLGVYACASSSMYWDEVVYPKLKQETDQMSSYTARINNGVDQLATRIAFHFHCLSAGTPVAMADGISRPIEEIAVGDQVLSYSRKNGGQLVMREVVAVQKSNKPCLKVSRDTVSLSSLYGDRLLTLLPLFAALLTSSPSSTVAISSALRTTG